MFPSANQKKRRYRNLPCCIGVLLGLVGATWVVVLLYSHSTLSRLHDELLLLQGHPFQPQQQQRQQQLPNHESGETKAKSSSSPFYGWQPETPAQDGLCSVRKCFGPNHEDCPLCRDLPNQMGDSVPSTNSEWIPDVTMLHQMFLEGHDRQGNPWPPPLSNEFCENIGVQGGATNDQNKKLLEVVPIQVVAAANATTTTITTKRSPPKVFCGIYTMAINHATNIRAMRETWAPRCDGFLAFSTASDPRIPALEVIHEGNEEYNNMWQKTRSIWRFIGTHYLQDFDYFILGGEDLFIIPENLRHYLQSLAQSPDDKLFAGRRFKGYGDDNYFNSGGAGYVLSRGTLRHFVETGLDHAECNPHTHTSMEDVMMAKCLRTAFDIGLTDTRDDKDRERFHPFAPGAHLIWRPPREGQTDWYYDYNREWGILLGKDCCAPDSVSFHYLKKPAMVRHVYSLLYHCR